MLDEQKVDDLFSNFIRSGNGSDEIRQIYDTLPYLNYQQQQILTLYSALAEKYDSVVMRELVAKVHQYSAANRPTGFRFTRLIESYSLYKHFKGYKASTNLGDTPGQ